MSNNKGIFTGIQIQNVASTYYGSAEIVVKYGRNIATADPKDPNDKPLCPQYPSDYRKFAGAGTSITVIQGAGAKELGYDTQFADCKYIGSAKITAGHPLVAIVNQVGPALASAYESMLPNPLTTLLTLPLVQANNGDIYSGIQIQNAGQTSNAVFTIEFGTNTATTAAPGKSLCQPASISVTLSPGDAATLILGPSHEGTVPQFRTCTFIGSAKLTGPTGGTVLINQIVPGYHNGDKLLTYIGFP